MKNDKPNTLIGRTFRILLFGITFVLGLISLGEGFLSGELDFIRSSGISFLFCKHQSHRISEFTADENKEIKNLVFLDISGMKINKTDDAKRRWYEDNGSTFLNPDYTEWLDLFDQEKAVCEYDIEVAKLKALMIANGICMGNPDLFIYTFGEGITRIEANGYIELSEKIKKISKKESFSNFIKLFETVKKHINDSVHINVLILSDFVHDTYKDQSLSEKVKHKRKNNENDSIINYLIDFRNNNSLKWYLFPFDQRNYDSDNAWKIPLYDRLTDWLYFEKRTIHMPFSFSKDNPGKELDFYFRKEMQGKSYFNLIDLEEYYGEIEIYDTTISRHNELIIGRLSSDDTIGSYKKLNNKYISYGDRFRNDDKMFCQLKNRKNAGKIEIKITRDRSGYPESFYITPNYKSVMNKGLSVLFAIIPFFIFVCLSIIGYLHFDSNGISHKMFVVFFATVLVLLPIFIYLSACPNNLDNATNDYILAEENRSMEDDSSIIESEQNTEREMNLDTALESIVEDSLNEGYVNTASEEREYDFRGYVYRRGSHNIGISGVVIKNIDNGLIHGNTDNSGLFAFTHVDSFIIVNLYLDGTEIKGTEPLFHNETDTIKIK